jgi:uncharacterized repeat protein (TIGR01451 family)
MTTTKHQRFFLLAGVCLLLLATLFALLGSQPGHAQAIQVDTANDPAQQACLIEVNDTPFAPVNRSSVAWIDYDKDNDLDLLIAGEDNDVYQTTLYRNDNGAFVDSQITLIGVANSTIAWGDYNKDGYPDLILTGENGDSDAILKLYRNDSSNGSRTLTEVSSPFDELRWPSAAWADYDNDGNLDLVISGLSTDTFQAITLLYRNNNGVFVKQEGDGYTLQGVRSGKMAWADYDRDNDLDLFVAGRGTEIFDLQAVLYRNDGGKFVAQTGAGYSFPKLQQNSVAWADYDNDGDPDLLLAGGTSGGDVMTTLYRNDNGNFVDSGTALTGFFSASVAWADYDNDNDLDLFIAGNVDNLNFLAKLYRNDGGNFTEQPAAAAPAFPGTGNGGAAWGDYDSDGDFDLVFTGSTMDSNVAKLYRNEGCAKATASLQLTKTVAPVSLAPGERVTYTLRFTNTGSAAAANLRITDSMPVSVTVSGVTSSTFGVTGAGITQISATPLPGAGIDFVWSIGELSANAGVVITLTGVLSTSPLLAGVTFTNTAQISADGLASVQASAGLHVSAATHELWLPVLSAALDPSP